MTEPIAQVGNELQNVAPPCSAFSIVDANVQNIAHQNRNLMPHVVSDIMVSTIPTLARTLTFYIQFRTPYPSDKATTHHQRYVALPSLSSLSTHIIL